MWQYVATNTRELNDTALSSDINGITFDNGRHTAAFDGESFWGHAYFVGFERSAYHWNFEFDYYATTPNFRADNGMEPTNDYQVIEISQTYGIYPKSKLIKQLLPEIRYERVWYFGGHKKYEWASLSLQSSLSSQTSLHQYAAIYSEEFQGVLFNNLWHLHFCASSNFSRYMTLAAECTYGHTVAKRFMVTGAETIASFSMELKPNNRLKIESSISYDRSRRLSTDKVLFDGYVAEGSANYHLNRELSLRLLVQYNDFYRTWNIDPLLTYRLGPFSAFYVGATGELEHFRGLPEDPGYDRTNLMSRQFFMKLQYMFQM